MICKKCNKNDVPEDTLSEAVALCDTCQEENIKELFPTRIKHNNELHAEYAACICPCVGCYMCD